MSNQLLLTDKQVQDFHRDGYVIVKGYYNQAEISKLQDTVFNDESLYQRAWDKKDATGTVSKVCLWQELGDDFYSMFSRGKRLADSVEKILGEPVFHTTTKIMMKEPLVGGAWEWHQDYGYWATDNFHLYPKIVSCMIAINKATIENGCLEVLKGSHHIGRIDHNKTGDQKGANMTFVEEALKHHELVKVELDPGDTLFFHCNLLHKSNQNTSTEPRWVMIPAYCAESAKPFRENSLVYMPLEKVEDNAIINWRETASA
ncbi:phytanoyl-CoA dioxygenase family protein [Shewanella sp. 1_MG-2023]|uniref:phytanoyl-CoA dioxygenase family protein n=1 Tax=unclassified Shewanella TaxID=196818 RepID=UPI0026E1BCE9|nr:MULTISPECIES: phytanoyl-CoA dioxygenase family protein [unclassified Shewanella]MDO6612308.1 phytanoyl-CoA dioxygenase family protein [Shewanella sp. 7_MG-2023]MDO6772162.1 phytanoyl-CoA dioxygenase family protein [Shewanella sp. 2_MG-2023]MDO6794068.1 phytanoyl-CoA dioxygenase family protein [Shewanella sp. 1_MG-2023]